MTTGQYNECVDAWSDALYRFACRCTGNREEARDVVQTSFATLWEQHQKVASEKAKAWLFQVAYRQAVDAFRYRKRLAPEDRITEESVSGNNLQVRRRLDEALDRLSEQARALVLLKDWEGYSYEEIGRITGLSESQVKVYLHRARQQLKTDLISIETVLS